MPLQQTWEVRHKLGEGECKQELSAKVLKAGIGVSPFMKLS
jgi:hypothetical protein